jgi:prevent-host-death family protein
MSEIGIRDLRKDLSRQVKRAAGGETIVVTIDGEPRAKLVPVVAPPRGRSVDELIAAGRVIPARRRQAEPPDPPPMFEGARPSSEILDELRSERTK